MKIEAYEASLTAPPVEITKKAGPSMAEKTIPLMTIEFKPIVACARASLVPVVH